MKTLILLAFTLTAHAHYGELRFAADQSLFEQLGSYFKQAKAPTKAELFVQRVGNCYAKDDLRYDAKIDLFEESNGPLLPAAKVLVMERRGELVSIPLSIMKVKDGSANFELGYGYNFRKKDNYLFVEIRETTAKEITTRCYFWAAE